MKLTSIQSKVLLLFLLLTIVLVLTMSVMVKQGFVKQFNQYKNDLAETLNDNILLSLQQHYQVEGNWDELSENSRLWSGILVESATDIQQQALLQKKPKSQQRKEHRKPPKRGQEPRLRPLPNFALLDAQKIPVVGKIRHPISAYKVRPINQGGNLVGYLLALKQDHLNLMEDKKTNHSFKVFLWTLALVMLLITLLASWPIARYFTEPIKAINTATKKAAAGDFTVRTIIERNDELGQLGQNFNVLTSTLQSNAEVQKKMMADIAHELRTPVAVLQAQIEAIQDGIHQPDKNNLGLLHQQVKSLSRFIQDLHQLSVSDLGSMQYQMQATLIKPIIESVVSSQQLAAAAKGIIIKTQTAPLAANAKVMGDCERLQQMLNNLLTNSVDYTHAQGHIELRCDEDVKTSEYVIEIVDSEPGLLAHEMAQIFDRLYRNERSRNKDTGGSGLGLAIVKNIVAAHNGTIVASESKLGGLCMTVRLPKHV